MSATLSILRAGPLTSLQDAGRFGMLRHGISASGPMDQAAFAAPGGGQGGIEFTMAGIELQLIEGSCRVGFAGGQFVVRHNGRGLEWPGSVLLETGDVLAVTPGHWGNYGYLRFDADLAVAPVLGSIATSSRARLGGLDGRVLRAGDRIALVGAGRPVIAALPTACADGPIRVIWGLHAELFGSAVRARFLSERFVVSTRLDRMGVRLDDSAGVFAEANILSLVSDAILPGDIQILGDGTPIVLMRDHQPTGGYPRIATVITADLDRFAQMRPGSPIAFQPVTVEHAQALLQKSADMIAIDLNADLGEGMGTDEDLLGIVSSASIACGGHAGDAPTIRHILKLCKARGVRAGAHPGYADPQHFGRLRLVLPLDELLRQIRSQLLLVRVIADEEGVPLAYVKLHGALANQTAEELTFAVSIFGNIQAMEPEMAVLALDNSQQVRAAKAVGMRLIREAYADRAYTAEGLLVPRNQEGAVIHDVDAVIERCLRLAKAGEIVAIDGSVLQSAARSICLHGDTPGAVDLARAVRDALEGAGIAITASAAEPV